MDDKKFCDRVYFFEFLNALRSTKEEGESSDDRTE